MCICNLFVLQLYFFILRMSRESNFLNLALHPPITKNRALQQKIKWKIWKRKLIKSYKHTTTHHTHMIRDIPIQLSPFLCTAFLIINLSGKLKFAFPMDYIDPAYYNMIYYMNERDILKIIEKSVSEIQFDAWMESRLGINVKYGRFR